MTLILLYILGGIICWPIFSIIAINLMENDFGAGTLDTIEIGSACLTALVCSMLWPIFVLAGLMGRFLTRIRARAANIQTQEANR